jgi:hypothetical protein
MGWHIPDREYIRSVLTTIFFYQNPLEDQKGILSAFNFIIHHLMDRYNYVATHCNYDSYIMDNGKLGTHVEGHLRRVTGPAHKKQQEQKPRHKVLPNLTKLITRQYTLLTKFKLKQSTSILAVAHELLNHHYGNQIDQYISLTSSFSSPLQWTCNLRFEYRKCTYHNFCLI